MLYTKERAWKEILKNKLIASIISINSDVKEDMLVAQVLLTFNKVTKNVINRCQ